MSTDSARHSTPQRSQPRVWALPTIPEDVKALRDAEGFVWTRIRDEHGPTLGFIQLWCSVDETLKHAHLAEIDLLKRGPLTEVTR